MYADPETGRLRSWPRATVSAKKPQAIAVDAVAEILEETGCYVACIDSINSARAILGVSSISAISPFFPIYLHADLHLLLCFNC